ncbi:MAG TPA: hypothetical protein VFX98_13095, partial [Longimicrobiaceae bacterium]|nr:hypothetical protein [Longimicrobiaceae bacterium]
ESAGGRALLAHELAHAAQAEAGPAPLRRDIVSDPTTGAATGYQFRVGTELRPPFATKAHGLVADGTLSDADIRTLVQEAVAANETVNDHERMFMAGLRDAANLAAFQAVRVRAGAHVTFPIGTIRRGFAHVVNIDRATTLPASVATPLAAASTAAGSLDIGEMVRQSLAAQTAAQTEIARIAGAAFRVQAAALSAFAIARSVSQVDVLRAMHAAASDSTPADQVAAGGAYAVAQSAGHAVAGDVLAGRVKVDALTPAALARQPGLGNVVAAYITAAQGSGLKGDTIYLRDNFDIADTGQRSVVAHELDHVDADKAAPAGGKVTFPLKVDLELRGYRAQARYLFAEMAGQTAAERATTAAQLAAQNVNLVYLPVILEAQRSVARFRPLAEILFGAAPAGFTLTPAQVGVVLGKPAADIERVSRAQIATGYGITATTPGVAEGLAGESITHWIDRI